MAVATRVKRRLRTNILQGKEGKERQVTTSSEEVRDYGNETSPRWNEGRRGEKGKTCACENKESKVGEEVKKSKGRRTLYT